MGLGLIGGKKFYVTAAPAIAGSSLVKAARAGTWWTEAPLFFAGTPYRLVRAGQTSQLRRKARSRIG